MSATAELRGLPPSEQTAIKLLQRQADRLGDRTFIRAPGGVERSYAETRRVAAAMAGALAAQGVRPGDRVATLCGNRIELLDLILGCAWAGAVVVPINVALRGAQLQQVLGNCGARLLMVEPELVEPLAAVSLPPSLTRAWCLDAIPAGGPPGLELAPLPELGPGVDPAPVGPGDALAILYTSGTTGVAKGVTCPHAQLYWWGLINSEVLEIDGSSVLFTSLPLFHTNAINSLFQALVAGATYAIARRFSASRYWEMAEEHDATHTYLLGAMVAMLQAQPAAPHDRRHRVRIALAPATPPPAIAPFQERFGVKLVDGYGSTETSHIIGRPEDEQRPGFLGRAVEEFDVRVLDDDDCEVARGQPGQLAVRGRHPFSLFTGYHAMPEATVEAWRNLWFHTGDQVVCDEDGWFRFLDRRKDTVRRRGENISTVEVERVLLEHPDVAAAAVFAVASELAEDEVMAAVVLVGDARPDPEGLMRHCEPRLAYFAIPRYVDFIATMPLTENGKIRKSELRERGVTERTWDREKAGYRLRR